METRQGKTLESLRAVQTFIDAHSTELGSVPTSGLRARLDGLVVELENHVATQGGGSLGSRGLTQRVRVLREALLRDHLRPLVRISRVPQPEAVDVPKFRMPRGEPSIERLAAYAIGVAETARPHEAHFVSFGLEPGFPDALIAAANKFRDAVDKRTLVRAGSAGATEGLRVTLGAARRVVEALDALVRREVKGDDTFLAGWRIASRVERIGVRHSAAALEGAETTSLPEPAATTMRLLPRYQPTAGVDASTGEAAHVSKA